MSSLCRLSARLSVCPSATPCIVALRVGVEGKSCTVVFLAGNFLLTSSDTFAVDVLLSHKKQSLYAVRCVLQLPTAHRSDTVERGIQ